MDFGKNKTFAVILICLTSCVIQSSCAAIIVNWGSLDGTLDMATSYAYGTANPAYDPSSPVSPALGDYGAGLTNQSLNYYGAITPNPLGAGIVFGVDPSDNSIQMLNYLGNGDGNTHTVESMIVWQDHDFLSGNGTLDTITYKASNRRTTTDIRYIIETINGWHISTQYSTHDRSPSIVTTSVSSLTWEPYSAFGVTSATGAVDLNNVKSVGLHFNSQGESHRIGAFLQNFTAETTAVPEPNSYPLMLGIAVTLFIGLVRRHR